MNLNSILGVVSSIVLFAPIILILAFKLFNNRSFLALCLYYFLSGIYNLISQDIFNAPALFSRSLGILVNLLDAPLMLLFLIFFSTSVLMNKRIRKLGELKNTRKELATIYGKTRTAGANNDGRFLKTGEY